jgi:hypothetical protein
MWVLSTQTFVLFTYPFQRFLGNFGLQVPSHSRSILRSQDRSNRETEMETSERRHRGKENYLATLGPGLHPGLPPPPFIPDWPPFRNTSEPLLHCKRPIQRTCRETRSQSDGCHLHSMRKPRMELMKIKVGG